MDFNSFFCIFFILFRQKMDKQQNSMLFGTTKTITVGSWKVSPNDSFPKLRLTRDKDQHHSNEVSF